MGTCWWERTTSESMAKVFAVSLWPHWCTTLYYFSNCVGASPFLWSTHVLALGSGQAALQDPFNRLQCSLWVLWLFVDASGEFRDHASVGDGDGDTRVVCGCWSLLSMVCTGLPALVWLPVLSRPAAVSQSLVLNLGHQHLHVARPFSPLHFPGCEPETGPLFSFHTPLVSPLLLGVAVHRLHLCRHCEDQRWLVESRTTAPLAQQAHIPLLLTVAARVYRLFLLLWWTHLWLVGRSDAAIR